MRLFLVGQMGVVDVRLTMFWQLCPENQVPRLRECIDEL